MSSNREGLLSCREFVDKKAFGRVDLRTIAIIFLLIFKVTQAQCDYKYIMSG